MSAKSLKVAIVGSGVSGLACAWLLSTKHVVTLFEKDARFGGHSHTVVLPQKNGDIAVDTGFIVYNEQTYPNLIQLFNYLNVPTQEAEMSFAVSLNSGRVEYSGTNFNTVFGQRKNLFSLSFWRMLSDIKRFYDCSEQWLTTLSPSFTLRQLLDDCGFSKRFIDEHIIPMGAAIWSTPVDKMLDYPALPFLRFCQNHGLLQLSNRPQWRTVTGGSRVYVDKLLQSMTGVAHCNGAVNQVRRYDDRIVISDHQANEQIFDYVVIATHADDALSLLEKPSDSEQSILSAFSYQKNKAFLHSDDSLMPVNRRVWSSWNYMGGQQGHGPSVTYWMNNLQSIDGIPLFVSLNPAGEPKQEKQHGSYIYDHPVFTTATQAAQRQIWSIQGQQRTWYCGAHLGHGFHEDGLQSGLVVAEQVGAVKRPWQLDNENYRLSIP